MGAPSSVGTQNQLTQQQIGLAQQQQQRSDVQYQQMQELEAPAINFNKSIVSGDPGALSTAAAPFISRITSGYNAAKESIMDTVPKGAARDYALSQLPVQQDTNISSTINNLVTSAYDKLANMGAGLGSFSLQETGAALSGYGGASSSNQSVMQAQEAAKASTMGLLGSVVGGVGTAATGTLKLSDRRMKKGIRSMRNSLQAALRLPVVTYQYVGGSDPQIGILAQDAMVDFPEIVQTRLDGMHAVDYGQLAAVTLQAVQDLAAQVERQQRRIEELETARCLTTH